MDVWVFVDQATGEVLLRNVEVAERLGITFYPNSYYSPPLLPVPMLCVGRMKMMVA